MEVVRNTTRKIPQKIVDKSKASMQIPRSFSLPEFTAFEGDRSQNPENGDQDQYVLSEKAKALKHVDHCQTVFSHGSAAALSDLEMVRKSFGGEYQHILLYPGLRSCIKSTSITTIICHHAGLSLRELESVSNFWGRTPAITHQIHVALLGRGFGLVLPAKVENTNLMLLNRIPQSVTIDNDIDLSNSPSRSASGEGGQRSDFEASAFMALMPKRARPIIEKADPEDLARRMLPAGICPPGARFVAACFWSFLCIIDGKPSLTLPSILKEAEVTVISLIYFKDLTEDGECSDCIDTAITSLTSLTSLTQLTQNITNIWSRTIPENPALKDCKIVITAFHHAICTTALFPEFPGNEKWKLHFWHQVGIVVKALQDEKPLHGRNFSMGEWMRLRILTISARPFMVLARASFGLPTDLNDATTSPRINQMQILVQSITGLQNDLLGWQKDHVEQNPMCAVEILIRNGMSELDSFEQTLTTHNEVVRALLNFSELSPHNANEKGWTGYVRVLTGFCHAMAFWMLESKRYHVLDRRMSEIASRRNFPVRLEDEITVCGSPRSDSESLTAFNEKLFEIEAVS